MPKRPRGGLEILTIEVIIDRSRPDTQVLGGGDVSRGKRLVPAAVLG